MNAKWKIAIYIAVTLVIGIAIGAMLNRALVRKHIRDSLSMRQAGLRFPAGERPFKPTDAEQEAKIQKVLDEHAERLAGIHTRYRTEIETAFKSLKDEMDPILTPEQKAELEKFIPGPPPPMPAERRGFPRPGGPGGFPGGPRGFGQPGPMRGEFPFSRGPLAGPFGLAVMKAELGLTEDQAAKIKAIQADLEKKLPWTPASRTPPPDPEVLRQAEQDARQAILKVLTDEQKEKLLSLLGPRSGESRAPKPLP